MRYYLRGFGNEDLLRVLERPTIYNLLSPSYQISPREMALHSRTFHLRVFYGDIKEIYSPSTWDRRGYIFSYDSLKNDLEHNMVSTLLVQTKWEF